MKWPKIVLNIKKRIIYFYSTRVYSNKSYSYTNTQDQNYELLQLCHRIEKGMIIGSPRAGWGEEKAKRIIDIVEEHADWCPEEKYFLQTATGVLSSFVEYKRKSGDYSETIKNIEKRLIAIHSDSAKYGGTVSLDLDSSLMTKEEIKTVEKAILSRHSIRSFSPEHVSISDIKHAIDLANHCPSACNRQPFRVYVISSEKRKEADSSGVFNADKYLIITGIINAFTADEFNDWIVSASIFAGYLCFCLHIYGIANCPIRMDLLERAPVYKKLRSICNIPDCEQIVLEIAIGRYNDHNIAPMSYRKNADNICVDCT